MFSTEDMQKASWILSSRCPYAFHLVLEVTGHFPHLQTGTWGHKKVILCPLVNKRERQSSVQNHFASIGGTFPSLL